jgi:hypothetical protein
VKLGTPIALGFICSERTTNEQIENSVKSNNIMKKYTAILAAVAAIGLCSTANAIVYPNDTVTLPGTGLGSAYSLQVVSSVSFAAGEYTYTYAVSPLAAGSQYEAFDVYFPTAGMGVFNNIWVSGGAGYVGSSISASHVDWSWAGTLQSGTDTVSFESPIGPTTGSAGGLDGTAYAETFGVYVPGGVPDGGLTIALLGGALFGLQMFRRKMVS